ncbi:Uncharacterized protein SCF082_LOCUS38535, partial [Durusdinium trenchii]
VPAAAASASTSTPATMSPPSTKDIILQMMQGKLLYHPTKQTVTAQELGQRIHSIQSQLSLTRGLTHGQWSDEAQTRLCAWLLAPRKNNKALADGKPSGHSGEQAALTDGREHEDKRTSRSRSWRLRSKKTCSSVGSIMAPVFNPHVPKRGKACQVLKRPGSVKQNEWKKVPYVQDPDALPCARGDQQKWKRSLPEILSCYTASLISMLRDDGLLRRWEGSVCLIASVELWASWLHIAARESTDATPRSSKSISTRTMLIHSSSKALATQSALLMLILNRVPNAAIHRLLHINHKSIEDFAKRLGQLREAWVVDTEKSICFGKDRQWADIEADEATFDRQVVGQQAQWEQWCAVVQRGKSSTLVLHRRLQS